MWKEVGLQVNVSEVLVLLICNILDIILQGTHPTMFPHCECEQVHPLITTHV